MKLSSPNFPDGGMIPKKFTQEGEDISPALDITNVPQGAKSIVLVCMDPDAPDPAAPQRTFIHWVVYNLPAHSMLLPEGADIKAVSEEAKEGLNDRGTIGYIGPKPPIGTHRYFFKAFALDCTLLFDSPPTLKAVFNCIDGRVIEMAEYMGRYKLGGN